MKRRKPRPGLSEYKLSHSVYDAVADVLQRHPALCLDDVMARHRLALDVARRLHDFCVPPKRRGLRRFL